MLAKGFLIAYLVVVVASFWLSIKTYRKDGTNVKKYTRVGMCLDVLQMVLILTYLYLFH